MRTEPDRHWDTLFTTRAEQDLGWFEPVPTTLDDALELTHPGSRVIDVGAGTSRLVDNLIEHRRQLTLVDLAPTALQQVSARLGSAASEAVEFITADITRWQPRNTWDLWHDRAAYHFLTEPHKRAEYRNVLASAIKPGGNAVIATFTHGGPERCAGLTVKRYNETELQSQFHDLFSDVECRTHVPRPTDSDRRPYTICRFMKRKSNKKGASRLHP